MIFITCVLVSIPHLVHKFSFYLHATKRYFCLSSFSRWRVITKRKRKVSLWPLKQFYCFWEFLFCEGTILLVLVIPFIWLTYVHYQIIMIAIHYIYHKIWHWRKLNLFSVKHKLKKRKRDSSPVQEDSVLVSKLVKLEDKNVKGQYSRIREVTHFWSLCIQLLYPHDSRGFIGLNAWSVVFDRLEGFKSVSLVFLIFEAGIDVQ